MNGKVIVRIKASRRVYYDQEVQVSRDQWEEFKDAPLQFAHLIDVRDVASADDIEDDDIEVEEVTGEEGEGEDDSDE